MEWDLIPSTNKLKSIRNTVTPWTTSTQGNRMNKSCSFDCSWAILILPRVLNCPPPICQNYNFQLTVVRLLISYPLFQFYRRCYSSIFLSKKKILSDHLNQILSLVRFLKCFSFFPKRFNFLSFSCLWPSLPNTARKT